MESGIRNVITIINFQMDVLWLVEVKSFCVILGWNGNQSENMRTPAVALPYQFLRRISLSMSPPYKIWSDGTGFRFLRIPY
jgi:hypothetical protein